jgi:hypothetical protein
MIEYKLLGFDARNQPIFQKVDHPIRALSQSILWRCSCNARTQVLFSLPYRCPDCGDFITGENQ